MQSLVNKGGIKLVPKRAVSQNDQYWFSTKTYRKLQAYNNVSNIDLFDKLDKIGLVTWLLDDGWFNNHCKDGNFLVACSRFTKIEFDKAIATLNRFNLSANVIGIKRRDISIRPSSNNNLKNLVHSVIPQNVDIVQRKINRLK